MFILTASGFIVVLAGWIILLIVGVTFLDKRIREGATLTIIGGLWGLALIALMHSQFVAGKQIGTSAPAMVRASVSMGWCIPAVVGLLLIRKHRRAAIPLMVFGVAWGFLLLGYKGYVWRSDAAHAPYSASISVSQGGDAADLRLDLIDRNGMQQSMRRFVNPSDPPGFEIVSKSGAVLSRGVFGFG